MRLVWPRYLVSCLCLAIAGFGGTAAFNYLADPYLVYFAPPIAGWTEVKPNQHNYLHLSKAHGVTRFRPEALIVGTSRAGLAYDPAHPTFAGLRTYNTGMPGATMREIYGYFEHAHSQHPLRRLVVGLDLSSFNALRAPRATFDAQRLSRFSGGFPWRARWRDLLPTLLSFDAIMNSIRVLRYQHLLPRFRANGFGEDAANLRIFRTEIAGQRKAFVDTIDNFMNRVWRPPPARRFCFDLPASPVGPMELFEDMVSRALADGVDVVVILNPGHAWLFEAIWQSGLWPAFESWKDEIVDRTHRAARRLGVAVPPVWDFALAAGPNIEDVPAPGDGDSIMRYHWELGHIRPALGDLVLDRIHTAETGTPEPAAGFGHRLTPEIMAEWHAGVRRLQTAWRETHGQDMAEIGSILVGDPALTLRGCPAQSLSFPR